MSVDVVILSWNRAELILETIANVQAQTGVDKTIWIVDQGSHDGTLDELRPLHKRGEIRLVELGQNYGVAEGRNQGNNRGQADVIVSLDNDAVFEHEQTLLHAVTLFDADPQLAAVGFRVKNFYTGQDDWLNWGYARQLWDQRASAFTATRFVGCGHAIRRSAWAQTQGYDSQLFFFWEELDLSYQLIALGYHIRYEPSLVVRHKVSPESRTNWSDKRYYYLVRNALYLHYKYYRSPRQVFVMAVGYLLKGAYNGLWGQPVRAIRDARRMFKGLDPRQSVVLDQAARKYVFEHDTRYRGNFRERLRQNIFVRLPK
ncbi:MAG: glycosyltransferase [Chloroflexi bacterium]|nr:glycosyltransferase [Chloroflexota bacterium]